MPFQLQKLLVTHVKTHSCVCKDKQSHLAAGNHRLKIISRQREKGGGRSTDSTAPEREDSKSMEKDALIFKLAQELVHCYCLFRLPRLKSSSYCPTESCSSFEADGQWPFHPQNNEQLCVMLSAPAFPTTTTYGAEALAAKMEKCLAQNHWPLGPVQHGPPFPASNAWAKFRNRCSYSFVCEKEILIHTVWA